MRDLAAAHVRVTLDELVGLEVMHLSRVNASRPSYRLPTSSSFASIASGVCCAPLHPMPPNRLSGPPIPAASCPANIDASGYSLPTAWSFSVQVTRMGPRHFAFRDDLAEEPVTVAFEVPREAVVRERRLQQGHRVGDRLRRSLSLPAAAAVTRRPPKLCPMRCSFGRECGAQARRSGKSPLRPTRPARSFI